MTYYVDRIEGNVAVLIREDRRKVLVSLSALPDCAHEGALLKKTVEGYVSDSEKETARKHALFDLQSRLKNRHD